MRPITYFVQLIYSPLLWLATCLTDFCKYTPSNPQHCWHRCVLASLHLKRIQLLQQIHWCKSFTMLFVSSVMENKQDWIIFDLYWKWSYWLVTLKTDFQGQNQMCRIVWPLLWTMERLSTLEKANFNNVWSMKLDIFSEWMSYREISNFPLSFLYKSFKFSTYNVI